MAVKISSVLNRGTFRVDSAAERAAFAGLVRSLRGSAVLMYATPRKAFVASMPREGFHYGKPVLFSIGLVEAVTRDDTRVLVSGHWIDVARLKFSVED